MWLGRQRGHLLDWITQVWVKTMGRKFQPEVESWLPGPIGSTERIESKFVEELEEKEGLGLKKNKEHFGLLDDFRSLELLALLRVSAASSQKFLLGKSPDLRNSVGKGLLGFLCAN